MHQVVVALLANKDKELNQLRQELKLEERNKALETKGTGRARQGSIRAPQWIKVV
ncbi:MAG: 50S ribosomal protein L4 [Streptococcus sp.]